MKRISSCLFLLFFFVLSTFSYASEEYKTDFPTIKFQRTYRFKPYWFMGASVGGQIYFGDHNKQMSISERMSPNFDFNVGKWINPNFGLRVGANGFNIKGLTQNGSYSTGELYDAANTLYKQSFHYVYGHADLLFHWSNDAYGYDPKRVYNLIPYVGVGAIVRASSPRGINISPNLGLLQTFRLTNKLDLTVDIRGNVVGDSFDQEKGGRKFEGTLTTNVGIVYKWR